MASPPSISAELRQFLESGVSILVGTRDTRLFPEAVRAVGARVEPGGREVTVLFPEAVGRASAENLRENGRIAVCFSRVDHRSIQLKGRLVELREGDAADREVVERYRSAWAESLAFIGLPPRLTFRVSHWPCHAARFRVESIFVQTPGPGAGDPLRTASVPGPAASVGSGPAAQVGSGPAAQVGSGPAARGESGPAARAAEPGEPPR